ncbi:MAG: tRNA 2-selenouridine(34) synthase MnmH [Peptostreptococcaceae bacterium]|nr:tRNA 2-selenouridine(34) synthase MnmH [Peptostreptococcaceae bacterium]
MDSYSISISEGISLESKIWVDVRSPLEFEEDHIPGALNIPILDNEERAIIGTIYKQEGKAKAVKRGLDLVSPKLKNLYQELEALTQKYEKVIIYCFRGGMRSGSVVDLARSCGLEVLKLEGGYKSYRRHVMTYLQDLNSKFRFIVLHGHTGIGKTEMLLELEKKGFSILDLEFLAKNSGSVFGDIYYKGKGPSQKFFETQLFSKFMEFEQKDRCVFLESESKKIGRCVLSKDFWEMMQNGDHILVEASLDRRVERCVNDYTQKGGSNDELLIRSIQKLKDKLGTKNVMDLIIKAEDHQYEYVARYLMENYYDKLYLHSQNKYHYDLTVNSDRMKEAVDKIISWRKEQ